MTANAATEASGWGQCYCCGCSFPAANMVGFACHPADAICVGCVAWLEARSRPIVRRLYPIWQLPARIRARSLAAGPSE